MKPLCFISKKLIYQGISPLLPFHYQNRAKLMLYELYCIPVLI